MDIFDKIMTKIVATPRAKPFVIFTVTASVGHRPNNCINPAFCFHIHHEIDL